MQIRSIFALIITLLFSGAALAQDHLLDSAANVHRHERQASGYQFDIDPQNDTLSAWGLAFYNEDAPAPPPYVVSYEALPACEKPEVRLIPVDAETPGTEQHDVLFYDPEDRNQAAKARDYQRPAVPYNPDFSIDRKTGQYDSQQLFARFLGIPCLPTRFHFTYIGSKRYAEYRFGDEAWK